MNTPLKALSELRRKLAREIETHGIREVARWCDLNPMRVQRFVELGNGRPGGAADAATLFILAGALGYRLDLKPAPRQGNQVAIALGLTHKALNPRRQS
jgi:hypothetical protein